MVYANIRDVSSNTMTVGETIHVTDFKSL